MADKTNRIVVIAAKQNGKFLLGQRADGKWSFPKGHVMENELVDDAAIRELKEETGLDPNGGQIEFVGDQMNPDGNHISLYHCDADGVPNAANDPSKEFQDFTFTDPQDWEHLDMQIPPEDCIVHSFMKDEDGVGKETAYWQGKDGLKIPVAGTPERKEFDNAVLNAVIEAYGGDDASVIHKVKIPVSKIQSSALPTDQDRLNLYHRMLAAGEELPPVVIRKDDEGNQQLIDGIYRLEAQKLAGVTSTWAYEIAEPLWKAIDDLKPGRKSGEGFSYSHMLSPLVRKKGYQLHLKQGESGLMVSAKHNGQEVGHLTGFTSSAEPHRMKIDQAGLSEEHRNKGIGKAMYEAMFAHAKHKAGVSEVYGENHSTLAHHVHSSLADKHGLAYNAKENWGPEADTYETKKDWVKAPAGPFDEKYGPYKFKLSELEAVEKSLDILTDDTQHNHSNEWTTDGLHDRLIPVAHLESKFGEKLDHAPHALGDHHTPFGAVGLKPVLAFEEYKSNKALQRKFPLLSTQEQFTNKLKNDPKFYNLVASSFFARLMARHGSPERAAFAWKWGTGAASKATDQQLQNDKYVQSYVDHTMKSGLVKSETLIKKDGGSIPSKELQLPPALVHAQQHALPNTLRHDEVHNMMHGLDLNGSIDRKVQYDKPPINQASSGWMKGPKGTVYVKDSLPASPDTHSDAQAEVAYHNLAKDFFGMGKYMPSVGAIAHPSTGKHHAIIENVPGSHFNAEDPKHVQHLKDLNESGESHKLALMNMVLQNPDRHKGNYIMANAGGLKLIDHGQSFSYANENNMPHYLGAVTNWGNDNTPMHPEAKNWAMSLKPQELYNQIKAHGIHDDLARESTNRLKALQSHLTTNPHSSIEEAYRAPQSMTSKGFGTEALRTGK